MKQKYLLKYTHETNDSDWMSTDNHVSVQKELEISNVQDLLNALHIIEEEEYCTIPKELIKEIEETGDKVGIETVSLFKHTVDGGYNSYWEDVYQVVLKLVCHKE